MQEILAEIWPPLLMVVFGGGSIVAAILGKAICSLDQNSSFRKSFNNSAAVEFFLQKEDVLFVY